MATRSSSVAPRKAPGKVLLNGAKAIADFGIVPGASLLAEGAVKSGTLHVLSALVAGSLFGPLGWFAVGADAFSRSVTGKHVYQHFVSVEKVDE